MNVNLLKGKVVENGLSVKALAETIGVDPSTMYRKLGEGGEGITVGEMNKISQTLNLHSEDIMRIFF